MHLLVTHRCPVCKFTHEYVYGHAALFPFEHCKGHLTVEIRRRYETITIGDHGELTVERDYYDAKIEQGYRVVGGHLLSQEEIRACGLEKEYPSLGRRPRLKSELGEAERESAVRELTATLEEELDRASCVRCNRTIVYDLQNPICAGCTRLGPGATRRESWRIRVARWLQKHA